MASIERGEQTGDTRGHARNNSAGINALMKKTLHNRTHSEVSEADSTTTFIVNVLPEYDGASYTDSDTVPFTPADGLGEECEGQTQCSMRAGAACSFVRRRAAQEWNLLCMQWRMYVMVCV
jgi:hypothetical protein